MSGAAERLRPLRGTGAGTVITGTVGAVSFRPLLLLDLDFDSGVAAAGGADAARGARFGLMLRDLAVDADASRAAAADDDDAAAGGPGGSSFLLLDLADFADVARVDSNLAASGAGSIFGV